MIVKTPMAWYWPIRMPPAMAPEQMAPPALPGINPFIAGCKWVLGVRRALSGLKTGPTHQLVWNYFIIGTMSTAIQMHNGWIWVPLKTLHNTRKVASHLSSAALSPLIPEPLLQKLFIMPLNTFILMNPICMNEWNQVHHPLLIIFLSWLWQGTQRGKNHCNEREYTKLREETLRKEVARMSKETTSSTIK